MNVSSSINEALTLATYTICDSYCASHNISVRAINRYDRPGANIALLTVDSESVSNQACSTNEPAKIDTSCEDKLY